LRNIGEVYALYEKKLKKSNALDFDDLIVKALQLLETDEDVLESYRERFKYILVDEYQDTNKVQYNLVKKLGQKSNGESNIFVVGDEDQSIYGWRGADIQNILDFEKDFEGAKVVKLEKNYRSTNVILDAANGVIKNNSQRKGKNLFTDCCDGSLIKLVETDNEKEEAFMVSALMRKEHKQNKISYSDMAILYRTNAQSRALEEGLIREGIPYKIVGGLKFYGRKEIKDIVSYLMLIQNQKDDVSFDRIINVPRRKIGQKTIDTLVEYADEQNISLFEASYEAENLGLTKAATLSVQNFTAMMEMLMIKKDVMSLSEFMEAVYEDTGYKKMLLEDVTIEGRSRVDNINEFLSAAKDFEERYEENSLEDFLSHTSLLADVDKTDETAQDTVTLLTVHSAKGLEFDTVFLTGLEEKMFPMIRQDDSDDDLEEERRLFYVAVTRAKRMLYITYANERMVFGHHEMRSRSRFIKEIPDCCFDDATAESIANKKINSFSKQSESLFGISSGRQSESSFGESSSSGRSFSFSEAKNSKLFKGSMDFGIQSNDTDDAKDDENNKENISPKLKSNKISAGDKIMHKAWGIGTIVQISGTGNDQKAIIAFDNKGIKTVMLSYAPIEKI
jgi:DNA helicase-2/ATP-dependent DNA helicase PcrA